MRGGATGVRRGDARGRRADRFHRRRRVGGAALRRGGGHPELCELLVEKGLKADAAAGDGETPVDLAEEEEHDEAVAVLKASLAK